MRAVPEVDANAGNSDSWGGDAVPDWSDGAKIPCRVWPIRQMREVDEAKDAVVEEFGMMTPMIATPQVSGRIARIEDRRGNVLFAGPLWADHKASWPTHVEWRLVKGREI